MICGGAFYDISSMIFFSLKESSAAVAAFRPSSQIFEIKRNKFLHNQYYVQQFFFLPRNRSFPSTAFSHLRLINMRNKLTIRSFSITQILWMFFLPFSLMFIICLVSPQTTCSLKIAEFSSSASMPMTHLLAMEKRSCKRWTFNCIEIFFFATVISVEPEDDFLYAEKLRGNQVKTCLEIH